MAANTNLIQGCLLYEYKLGIKAAKTRQKVCTPFGDDTVSNRTAQMWFRQFSSEDLSLTDGARSGRLKIINNKDIEQVLEANSSRTLVQLAEWFNVSETIRLQLH
ncbi:hypothetical protein Trydic_g3537 [Trypoxylus dichotomus]